MLSQRDRVVPHHRCVHWLKEWSRRVKIPLKDLPPKVRELVGGSPNKSSKKYLHAKASDNMCENLFSVCKRAMARTNLKVRVAAASAHVHMLASAYTKDSPGLYGSLSALALHTQGTIWKVNPKVAFEETCFLPDAMKYSMGLASWKEVSKQ